MISQASNQSEFSISKLQNQNIIEQEVDKWDYNKARLVKTKVQIRITSENNLIYPTVEGVILRQEINQDNSENLEVLNNMEQIAHLQWHGEYGQNQRKLGKWEATWDGEVLQSVGGYSKMMKKIQYYKEGLKEGLWKEPIKHYWSKAQVFESGEYCHNQKQGSIIIDHQCIQTIGGGSYNEQAQKIGKWTDLHKGICDDLQVILDGEYKYGQKVGSWNILNENLKIFMIITNCFSGGGSFGDDDGIKQGSWVELWNGFTCFSWVTENGVYHNGKKVCRWDMQYKDYDNKQNFKIGGGQYDEGGKKLGNWVELSDGFSGGSQVTYAGVYNYGKKIGIWNIWYEKEYGDQKKERIGGGSYDDGSNKVGNWEEVSDGFSEDSQVTYVSVYKNGNKIGKWDIWYQMDDENIKMQEIKYKVLLIIIMCVSVEGEITIESDGIKFCNLVEESDRFNECSQITWEGEYKKGIKIGKWNIFYENSKMQNYIIKWHNNNLCCQQSGGGSYEDEGQGIKLGNWVEVSEQLAYSSQVTWEGKYENGKKIGRWNIWYKNEEKNQLSNIGGSYNERGTEIKLGNWVEVSEVSEEFQDDSQVTKSGEYKNGKNVGIWLVMKGQKIVKEINYDK